MTDSSGVTAVASAPSAPEAFTRTSRSAETEFLPVLREVSSSGRRQAETLAWADSPRDGHAEAPPGRDDVADAVSPADEMIALREPATVPSLDMAVHLFALVPPSMVATEVRATAPTTSPEGGPVGHGASARYATEVTPPTASREVAPGVAQVTIAASTTLGADVPSIDRPSLDKGATATRPTVDPDPAAVRHDGAPGARPAFVPDPPAVTPDAALAPAPASVPDSIVVGHDGPTAPGAPAAPAETTKARSAAAPHSSAVIERLAPIAQEIRGESPAGTAIGTTAAADLRPHAALVHEVAAAAPLEWTARGDGGDRGRDGDTARSKTDGALGTSVGVAEPRAAVAADTPQAPEPSAAPRPVVDQIAQRVLLIARDGRHEVSMRLDPPELGALRIDAVLTGSQLTLNIRTEGEPTRDLLEQALPRLREALSQHGITAERVTVQVGLDSGPREFLRNGGEAFHPMPQVARSAAAPRLAAAAPAWRDAVTDGFEVWV